MPRQTNSTDKKYSALSKSGSNARLNQKTNETPFKQSKFSINDNAMKQVIKKAQNKKQKTEIVADEGEQQELE